MSGSARRSCSIAAGTRPASAVGRAPIRSRCAPPGVGGCDLGPREFEASGDRVGVLEQDLSLGGQLEPARASLEQPCTKLAFELGHLGGDRRLRQRELTGGTGEGTLVRDHAEGKHPPRIHRKEL